MNRRDFLRTVGVAAAPTWMSYAAVAEAQSQFSSRDKKRARAEELVSIIHAQNDLYLEKLPPQQNQDLDSIELGGFPNKFGLHHAGSAAWNVNRLVCGVISTESRFFQSETMLNCLNQAIAFLRRVQHGDGTIDLLTTNFHSTPDTGFVVEPIALALSCVRKRAPTELAHFQEIAEQFLLSAGEALARGGIHTPNHRWVVSMALAWINHLFPNQKYLDRIDQWLTEKIDIDEDGQYAERSTSVYSPLTNRCLISIARLADRSELLAPVRKSLETTRYFVRPNGELVTEVSRRQDQYRIAQPHRYYYPARWMAIHDDDKQLSGFARFIEENVGVQNLASELSCFLEDELIRKELPTAVSLPNKYEKFYRASGVARIRDGAIDATILSENSTFFAYHHGTAALRAVRMASAFFGKGQFVAESMSHDNGVYRLVQKLEGPYYQPLATDLLPGDGDWQKMDRDQRPRSEVQSLETIVTIRRIDKQFKLHFQTKGTKNVPVAIELAFGEEGALSGVVASNDVEDSWLIESEGCTYQAGDDLIKINAASNSPRRRHAWTQIRGALTKHPGQCVYVTDFTPLDLELTIG